MHTVILQIVSWLVPLGQRSDWLKEWRAELWYLERAARTRFCFGALPDAAWLRVDSVRVQIDDLANLRGPIHCLAVLVMIAAANGLIALLAPEVRTSILGGPVPSQIFALSVAVLLVSGTVGLDPSLYRFRCWAFLSLKIALLAAAVLLGAFDLGWLLSRSGLQPHAALIGYALAFRWALADQRRRCPKCLCRLTDPVNIGQPANTLLDWYGTEFVCARGHGVMYLPTLPATSYCVSRWIALDASWQDLFR